MTYEVPEFAICQNSHTKLSFVWIKTKGECKEFPVQDYEHLRLFAELIRTDPDPVAIMEASLPGEPYSGDEKLTSPEEVKKKKKATVRISLPPKHSDNKQTMGLDLPPDGSSAIAHDTLGQSVAPVAVPVATPTAIPAVAPDSTPVTAASPPVAIAAPAPVPQGVPTSDQAPASVVTFAMVPAASSGSDKVNMILAIVTALSVVGMVVLYLRAF